MLEARAHLVTSPHRPGEVGIVGKIDAGKITREAELVPGPDGVWSAEVAVELWLSSDEFFALRDDADWTRYGHWDLARLDFACHERVTGFLFGVLLTGAAWSLWGLL